MLANCNPDLNIGYRTDTEIYAAIRYLEPDTGSANEQKDDTHPMPNPDKGVVICACLYIAALVGSAFSWFYSR
jgi:hypothetical protein